MPSSVSPLLTAHVLFTDVVGYSRLTSDQQSVVFRKLQEYVNDCEAVVETARNQQVVRIPSGDGMALAFFDQCSNPLRCACELADRIERDGSFIVRMGIHTGEVTRLLDINGRENVSGEGINTAQRVMDFGDGGHILMSVQHATCLQEAHDPAASECYDIGVATAKHGTRIHLFNFHRSAVGTPEVPVKVRQDDEWIRPQTLRLSTSGHNVFLASLQILGWLFISPRQWRLHVNQIDPRLTPNFSVIDLSGAQLRRNRDLRELLLQVYVICPCLLTLLIWAALTPIASALNIDAAWWIGAMWAGGLIFSVLLGVGAGLVGFVLLTFDAVVQAPAIGLFGIASAANQIALTIICVWGALALSAIFPNRRTYSVIREVLAALAGFLVVTVILVTLSVVVAGRPPLFGGVAMAIAVFILINVVTGLRWKQWSRGFVVGQVLGMAAGAVTISLSGATMTGSSFHLQHGIVYTLGNTVLWVTAFALAEKIGGSRAAIMAGLMFATSQNITQTLWSLLPLSALWLSYVLIRRRSLARDPAGGARVIL
ncbi:MAG: adenylate/guanylate cyclase domain-containing protein [Chthoniobacterales bacterium]